MVEKMNNHPIPDQFGENFQDNKRFHNLTITELRMEKKEFIDCEFSHCDFKNGIFSLCNFRNCRFVNCDLSLIRVGQSVFTSTRFEESNLIGINWAQASWQTHVGNSLFIAFSFYKCILDFSSFTGIILRGTSFRDSNAREVDFSECDLRKVDFSGTDLSGSQFRNSDLREANLVKATNYTIIPAQVKLGNTRVSLPEAISFLGQMGLIFPENDKFSPGERTNEGET